MIGLWRRPMTSTLSAPRRSAGDSGVFWRRPPSQKKRSPTATAGNRIGSAADASACSGPMVTACARTNGSLLHSGIPPPARCTYTTVFPEPMSVAVTDSDSNSPCSQLLVMRPQGIRRRTTRSSCCVCTMPPRRRCPSNSSIFPLPSSVAGARRKSLTPKATISSRTKLSQRSHSMRPCLAAMSAGAGDETGVDAAHRRTRDDVELHLPAQIAREILAQVTQHPGLVRAARPAARQNQGDAGPVAASTRSSGRAHQFRLFELSPLARSNLRNAAAGSFRASPAAILKSWATHRRTSRCHPEEAFSSSRPDRRRS